MATAYRAARVLDGKFERVIENGAVLTEDDRIVSVGPAAEVSPGTEVEDLGDVTLLPGLTGTHVYLGLGATAKRHGLVARESHALTALRCVQEVTLKTRADVTTVRDVGASHGLSVDVARAVALGVLPGPRIVAAGRVIAKTGGNGWFLGRKADGVNEVRRATCARR